MQIVQKNYGDNGAFYLLGNEGMDGQIDYTAVTDGVIAITHTEVNPEYRNEGYAQKLVDAVVDYARKNNLKIIPICPYAKAVMNRDPGYNDVLVNL